MKQFYRTTFFVLILLLLTACSQVNNEVYTEDSKLVEVDTLSKIIASGIFQVSNPGSRDYRAYIFKDEELDLYLSFKPEIIGANQLQSFIDNFNYINIWVHFPDEETDSKAVYHSNLEPIRDVKFVSYENKILTGELSLHIDEITTEIYDTDDESCITDDMMGICYSDRDANIDYTLRFSLLVP